MDPNASFFHLSWLIILEIISNPGRIKMYTAGWRKVVLILHSVSNIASANTDNDRRRSKAVIVTDQTNIDYSSNKINCP